jgi:hypothetical protein
MNKQIEEIVATAIGQASMCWEFPDKAGEFQSDKALEITAETLEKLAIEVNKLVKQTKEEPLNKPVSKKGFIVLHIGHYDKEELELPEDILNEINSVPVFTAELINVNCIEAIQLDYSNNAPKYGNTYITLGGAQVEVKETVNEILNKL